MGNRIFKSPAWLNDLLHCKQLCAFSSEWVSKCLFKVPASVNDLLHCAQLCDFSPVWVIKCLVKCWDCLNDLLHCECVDLGKHHHKNIAVHLGIAQIALGPLPRTQTGTLWHLFSGKIIQMPVCTWTFLLKIGATNHPGKGLDPPPQTGNAQMNCYIFMVGLP